MEENLQEKLINKKEIGWETIDEETKKKIFEFSQRYMNFLNKEKKFSISLITVIRNEEKALASAQADALVFRSADFHGADRLCDRIYRKPFRAAKAAARRAGSHGRGQSR